MNIKYYCPVWGMSHLPLASALKKIKDAGYSGAEIALDPDLKDVTGVKQIFSDNGLDLLILLPYPKTGTPANLLSAYLSKLDALLKLNPVMINSHTGKDYFTLKQNLEFIMGADKLSKAYGIMVAHETHRGRFAYSVALTANYIDVFPDLKLTADFSHWCVVSESLLEDQQEILDKIIPHCIYIHARVGYAQGPQVLNPGAPEYENELQQHTKWWQQIIDHQRSAQKTELIITPEFGPPPYMQALPFTDDVVADQFELNLFMKYYLTKTLK
jgi:sugar phosphate isomerase/epimerase